VTVTDPGPEGHGTFFVGFRPTRPDWPAAMTTDEEQALGEHAQGLSDLADAGTCVLAGPCLDAQLGVAVYDGLTVEDVVAQLEADAMVVAGFFTAEVRAMRLSFEREKPA
jgi:uncharacterized protein YciI